MKDSQDGPSCQIKWPKPGKHRARKVVSRSKARVTGKYPSWKAGRMVQWESLLELDADKIHDVDSEILDFGEQPALLIFVLDGETHRHWPDLLLVKRSGRCFVEIKDRQELNDPFVRRRAAYLSVALAFHGFGYQLMGPDEIRREPRLGNATQLLRMGRTVTIPGPERERIRRTVARVGRFTWGALTDGLLGEYGVNYAARLILEGELQIDFDAQWNADTIIQPASPIPEAPDGRR